MTSSTSTSRGTRRAIAGALMAAVALAAPQLAGGDAEADRKRRAEASTISLKTAAGKKVTTLKAGTYSISVKDHSAEPRLPSPGPGRQQGAEQRRRDRDEDGDSPAAGRPLPVRLPAARTGHARQLPGQVGRWRSLRHAHRPLRVSRSQAPPPLAWAARLRPRPRPPVVCYLTGRQEWPGGGPCRGRSALRWLRDRPRGVGDHHRDAGHPPRARDVLIRNRGKMTHGFEIEFRLRRDGDDIRVKEESIDLRPGQSTRMTMNLAPGVYEIECSVSNHDDMGMRGVLEVRKDAPLVAPRRAGGVRSCRSPACVQARDSAHDGRQLRHLAQRRRRAAYGHRAGVLLAAAPQGRDVSPSLHAGGDVRVSLRAASGDEGEGRRHPGRGEVVGGGRRTADAHGLRRRAAAARLAVVTALLSGGAARSTRRPPESTSTTTSRSGSSSSRPRPCRQRGASACSSRRRGACWPPGRRATPG